jgi:hypothetical protein
MFDLKIKWETARSRPEEFEYHRNAKTGRTDEQFVRYVFFAVSSLKCPPTEVLSMASEHLIKLGGIARLKGELLMMD